jgi:hypothetical protein
MPATPAPTACACFCHTLPSDELVHEKEKYKSIADEMDTTFAELAGY